MDFDHVLNVLGDFGRYQKFVYSMLCCMMLPTAFIMMGQVFTSADVKHRCYIPEIDGQSEHLRSTTTDRINQTLLTRYIPFVNKQGHCQLSECYRYFQFNQTVNFGADLNHTSPLFTSTSCIALPYPITSCDNGWIYYHDNGVAFHSSAVTEWDLVCDRAWLREVARSSVYAGTLVGSLLVSPLCDRFGRRPVIFLSLIVNVISGISTALSPFFQLFIVSQFICGITYCGVYSASYIYVQEWIGKSKRTFVACTVSVFMTTGLVILTGIAYFIRQWRALQLLISIPQSTILAYWWFIPESPRWLLSQGRVKEAEVIIMMAARINKADLCPLLPMQGSWKVQIESSQDRKHEPKYTVFDLLRTPKLRSITLNVFFHWIAVCMVYFGVSLNVTLLPGNTYVNFCILSLMDIPGCMVAMVLTEKLGRPKSLCLYFVIAGLGCIGSSILPEGPLYLKILSITLAMAGRMGAASSFYSSWLYTTELYPTVLRSTGIGAANCVARFGGIGAPFIYLLSTYYWKPSAFVAYGSVAIIAGLLILMLPETKNKYLPTTIEDVENSVHNEKKKKKRRHVFFAPVLYSPKQNKEDSKHIALKNISKSKNQPATFNVEEKLLDESRL